MSLLGAGDVAPFRISNPAGQSPFLLIGDHSGNLIPIGLDGLGLDAAELSRHIAIDLGVSALGARLSQRLDACFIEQRYSRLVIDCNRHAQAADAMAGQSDGTRVPGNHNLSPADRAARLSEIYHPYHRAIAEALVTRQRTGRATVLIALHSFTPNLAGVTRPWDVGVLHAAGDVSFALALLATLRAQDGLCIGDNQPYQMDDTDYTVPRHAGALPYAEVEVNQARLADDAGIAEMAEILAVALTRALDDCP